MRTHDEVYNKVLEEMTKYEERKQLQRRFLRTRVLPTAIAVVLIAAVGLFVMWRNGLIGSPKLTSPAGDHEPGGQLTVTIPEPSKPQHETAKDPEKNATVSAYKRIPVSLDGYPIVYTSLISADGKTAYASTMIESGGEDSIVSVSATFYGINLDTNTPVELEGSEVITCNAEGQSYSIVSCRIPESSNITITKVVSDHSATFDNMQCIQTILRAEAGKTK